VSLPEKVSPVSAEESIEWVRRLSSGEGWVLSEHNEQNNPAGKEVNRRSMVGFSHMDFWCHITFCPQFCFQSAASVSPGYWGSESEVCYFEVELGIIENIFWFEVSMCNSFLMNIVKAIYELSEVEPGNWFIEPSSCCYIIK